jgi:hypothetical protein
MSSVLEQLIGSLEQGTRVLVSGKGEGFVVDVPAGGMRTEGATIGKCAHALLLELQRRAKAAKLAPGKAAPVPDAPSELARKAQRRAPWPAPQSAAKVARTARRPAPEPPAKRPVGRPRKVVAAPPAKRPVGRPRKVPVLPPVLPPRRPVTAKAKRAAAIARTAIAAASLAHSKVPAPRTRRRGKS